MMIADLTLRRAEHVPQGFCFSDGALFASQANTTTGDAWVTRYTHLYGQYWRWDSEMSVIDSHGWPLFANTGGGGQIGTILTTGTDAFHWFDWQPGAVVGTVDGIKTSKIPIADGLAGGWSRVTASGVDKFYKDGTLKHSRPSPGWVQGELVIDDVLLTLRGSPTYTGNPYPYGVRPVITYTLPNGQVDHLYAIPECVGLDPDACTPVGGRAEHEGLVYSGGKLLIGTAVNWKPGYRYQITELTG